MPQKIHIIGIGGSGASGVARYLHALGFEVSGSDIDHSRTVELKKLGIRVADAHGAKNIVSPDLVLMSPGVHSGGTEVRAARQKGIPVLPWQEFLGRYLGRRPGKGFMVAGTYGKGLTAAILTHILEAAYLDPLVILGVEDIAWNSNVRVGYGDSWVLEADEYNRHFQHFHPSYVALTSLEHEHITTYPTFAKYLEAFATFFAGMDDPKTVVTKKGAATDDALAKIFPRGVLTYSITEQADVFANIVEENLNSSRFVLNAPRFGIQEHQLELHVPGRLQVENAVGAIALTLAAGIEFGAVNGGLATFKGLRRRFEVIQRGAHATIFDYAHTPDRIRAVIDFTKQLFPGRRVVVLFEPHLYSRTEHHRQGFREVLQRADRVYITDIFPAREARSHLRTRVHSKELLVDGNEAIAYAGSLQDGIKAVAQARTERDVVLVLGAGPIQVVAETLAA